MSSTISSQIAKTIEEIRRADYEGDRIALKTLFADLEPYIDVPEITARALYWRGFAMWRSAINGFNDGATPGELEESLAQAMRQFEDSLGADTDFIEAKIGLASSTGLMAYLQRRNDDLVRELTSRTLVALKEIQTAAPDNPRFLWVMGQILWNSPAESGGQQKAIEGYKRGLEILDTTKKDLTNSLQPSWGRAELLMSLAWANLNLAVPDVASAEVYAHQALVMISYWHYVRDILLPQIHAAKAKNI